jgi:hypothetical protein
VKLLHQILRQRSASAFCKDGDFRVNINARLVIAFSISLAIDSFVASTHTDNAFAIAKDFDGGKAGKHFNSAGLYLRSKPAHEAAQGNNQIAIVVERWRCDGNRKLSRPGQKENAIFAHHMFDRSAALLPIRHQFIDAARIHDSSRNAVGANLLAFFEYGDGEIRLSGISRQLAQMPGGCQPCRTTANDQNINLEDVAIGHGVNRNYASYRLNNNDALVPPNPKEFESA